MPCIVCKTQSVSTASQKSRKGNREKVTVTQRVVILCHRESHFSAEAFILTVELTLAAPLIREMAAGCAAKRNTGMRAKGILTTEWWNRSKNFQWSVILYSVGLLFYLLSLFTIFVFILYRHVIFTVSISIKASHCVLRRGFPGLN